MADYIYLLQTRLTPAQQNALAQVREVARTKGMTVFLVGGAVRDLTSGSPVRDLDVAVQGNALKLRKELLQAHLTLVGESDIMQALYFTAPGGVRLEVGSTLSITYPKPGKPVAKPANILEDLRRRDFTANAMAISLNEGSFGLLMDPLNGVADIENRELRLVSPYGFIEDPSRMIRAVRFGARLGFQMEEKTQKRYETGKTEGYISALNPFFAGYETEEIAHEEDPIRVLKHLESEGWLKSLFPAWGATKANENEINKLRDTASQLQGMGIHADTSAAMFPLATAKLAPKEVAALKNLFPRQGFVDQIAKLEGETKDFAAKFTSKAFSAPSDTWKLLMSAIPEQVLSLAHSSKSAAVQAKFAAFFNEWPQARQRIPYQTMQEMRIVPDLPIYKQLIEDLFFAIMDKKLETLEATKAFLEPFSPPAPPPPVNMRRRAVKREAKPAKSRSKKAIAAELEAALGGEPVPADKPAVDIPAKSIKAPPAKEIAKPVPAPKAIPVKAAPAKVIAAKAAPAKMASKAIAGKALPTKTIPAKKVAAKKPLAVVAKAKAVPAKKIVAKKAAPKKAVVVKKPVAKSVPPKKTAVKAKPVKKVAAKKLAGKPKRR